MTIAAAAFAAALAVGAARAEVPVPSTARPGPGVPSPRESAPPPSPPNRGAPPAPEGKREEPAPSRTPIPRGAVLEEVAGRVREVDRKTHRITVETASGPVVLSLDRNSMVYTATGLGTVLDLAAGQQIRAGRNADFLAYWVQLRATPPAAAPAPGTGPAGSSAAPATESTGSGTSGPASPPAPPAGGATGSGTPRSSSP